MAGLVVETNIDENPGTAKRFGVRSIRTLLVLKGGKEVDRLVGVQPKQEIRRRLENVLNKSSPAEHYPPMYRAHFSM